ncbi:MAG TPA: hypothetical protein EYQ25_11050 [Planctomycetes bacterium]|nr:hypothetical protein [Planctomycetota bacterium]
MTAKQNTQTPTPPTADHKDDLIAVPKEQSKMMYMFILALMLFVLIIFTIGDAVRSALTGGGGSGDGGVVVTWIDPVTGEEHSIKERVFMERKQSMQILMEAGFWSPVNPEATRATVEDEDVLLYEVLDQLAANSGIVISDQEYINTLRGLGFTDEILRQFTRRFRMDGRTLKDIIKAGIRPYKMRVRLLGSGLAYSDPLAIEATWKENNPEYAFQYIELKREDYVEQARANALPEEELIAWLDEQSVGEQQRYQTEPKVRADVVWVSPGEAFDASLLMEKYPAPEGTDADARGSFYFNTARSTRFRYVEPKTDEGTDDAATDDAATDDAATDEAGADEPVDDPAPEEPQEPAKFYYDYEEVKEQAIAEAAIWDAMTAFLEDVRTRMQVPDSQVDWAAEASALGLEVTKMEQPVERSKIAEIEGWGGSGIANQLSFSQVDTFVPRVWVEEGGLVIARLLEKTDPERKPWEEIQEEVLTHWARGHAMEMAVDSLKGVLEFCAERGTDEEGEPLSDEEWTPEVSAEDLRKSAGAANFTLVERPLRTRMEWPGDDPNLATPADRFIRGQPDLFELEPGQVAYPRKDFTGNLAYLVRLNQTAEPDPKKKLKAQELLALRQSSQTDRVQSLIAAFFPKSDWFSTTFSIAWPQRENDDADPSEQEPEEPAGDSN